MKSVPLDSDEQLFERIKEGDNSAFSEIYNRYWDKLYQVAGHKLGDGFQAQEVVQELFVDIWRRRREITIQRTAAIYLAAALKYKIINARLKTRRDAGRTIQWDDTISDKLNYQDQPLGFKELQTELEKLVINLPDKSRLVYQMSREDGFNNKEIAGKLHISEKTVEYHLTRALKILRKKLLEFHLIRMFFKNMFTAV